MLLGIQVALRLEVVQGLELALAEVKVLQPITEILTSNLEQSALLPSIWTK